jgi:protein-arginine kinase activator protein McsA
MEKKEKPLEKLTAKELREMALGIEGIHGVHGMKKEELISAIRKAKGMTEPEGQKGKKPFIKKEKVVLTKAELKKKGKELRLKREEALQQQDWKLAAILRKRIRRFKKMTRRVTA